MRYVEKTINSALVQEARVRLAVADDYDSDPRVRDIIRIVYQGCCAYCECKPEAGASYQIEHYYPKSKDIYKEYRKDIFNLHYACPACNTKKSVHVPTDMLTPNYRLINGKWVSSDPGEIESLMYYNAFKLETTDADAKEKKALNTINKLKLNDRPYLVEDRIRTFNACTQLIEVIKEVLTAYRKSVDDKTLAILFKLLKTYTSDDSAYSTMIIQNYGVEIKKLLKVWKKLRK